MRKFKNIFLFVFIKYIYIYIYYSIITYVHYIIFIDSFYYSLILNNYLYIIKSL